MMSKYYLENGQDGWGFYVNGEIATISKAPKITENETKLLFGGGQIKIKKRIDVK